MAWICKTDTAPETPCLVLVTGYDNDPEDSCVYIGVIDGHPRPPRIQIALNANEARRLIRDLTAVLTEVVDVSRQS